MCRFDLNKQGKQGISKGGYEVIADPVMKLTEFNLDVDRFKQINTEILRCAKFNN